MSHQPSVMTWLTSFLRRPPIGLWDLADILVVSILIYEVLKLIRGTRAVQMALGGGLFVFLFYGSRWGHLDTVNWLVRNLAGYIVFAVIVRQIGLRHYIGGGIRLDAVLTYDLLQSIFLPSSPLHDGAVIVQEDRVAAAACFLPLTVNPKLSKELGSRHRAAIGLTEENDSVAVVVSEETGIVSIVVDGQIERGLDSEQLRAQLRALVLQRREKSP